MHICRVRAPMRADLLASPGSSTLCLHSMWERGSAVLILLPDIMPAFETTPCAVLPGSQCRRVGRASGLRLAPPGLPQPLPGWEGGAACLLKASSTQPADKRSKEDQQPHHQMNGASWMAGHGWRYRRNLGKSRPLLLAPYSRSACVNVLCLND